MQMNCLEARKCIYHYLNGDLGEEKLRSFLQHLTECPECMEELRITHMVYSGVAKLDSSTDDPLDLERDFRRSLEQSRFLLLRRTGLRITCYAVETAAFWSLLLSLLLYLRLYFIG
ncbi:zf-HC2 domain-containing protein [Oribacterium sp. oral taxon 102]|uniref:anti-sigma factor family protein n=1 Tax=Oribacterium sp. oral taxon 102 TaxID=671214 RepID=UPI0015BA1D78|nr:zf-HC2 domain-containing protein [Oribacterium sp. oral taxon 102]NWO21524.1 zf-HC2 domain-containing protein [Oribacterium sp. oral taxon 102]